MFGKCQLLPQHPSHGEDLLPSWHPCERDASMSVCITNALHVARAQKLLVGGNQSVDRSRGVFWLYRFLVCGLGQVTLPLGTTVSSSIK